MPDGLMGHRVIFIDAFASLGLVDLNKPKKLALDMCITATLYWLTGNLVSKAVQNQAGLLNRAEAGRL